MIKSKKSRLPVSSRKRFLRNDKEGVASTVGTIMALLVFLAFLGLFTNSYIPVWMLDNERNHMNEVINQVGEFKSRIDSLIVNAQITGESEITQFTPLTLGADGIPVFASPTMGQLKYQPYTSNSTGVSISFNYSEGSSIISTNESGGGSLELYAPNRYYVQQWVAYENGAILIKQEDGQAVRATPSIEMSRNGTEKVNLAFTQIDFIGKNATISGAGSVGMSIDLKYLDTQVYSVGTDDNPNNQTTITFTTKYNQAWADFFNERCSKLGLNDTQYSVNTTAINEDKGIYSVTFILYETGRLTYNHAYVEVDLQI